MKNVKNVLVGTPKGKRPFERPSCKYEDNSNMSLKRKSMGASGLNLYG
jgi:hypothetical protein